MTVDTTIVVPCYNEARRLPLHAFRAFAAGYPRVRFLFVDDGSTDDTREVVESLAATSPHRFQSIALGSNRGKAEAVRIGMSAALSAGSRYAGYWDADLATPLSEISRFIETLETHPERDICFGARVQLLGRVIDRRPYRHYIGRLFATAASVALRLPVYDTQCGAKLFRVTAATDALFDEPFIGKWTFDVEIIARLTRALDCGDRGPAEAIYELPLNEWRDVDGSKVRPLDFVRSLIELFSIRWRYRKGCPPQDRSALVGVVARPQRYDTPGAKALRTAGASGTSGGHAAATTYSR